RGQLQCAETQVELLHNLGSPAAAHEVTQRGVLAEPLQGMRQGWSVARWYQQTRAAIVHELRNPGDAARHHGQATGHPLHQGDRNALPLPPRRGDTGQHNHVCGREQTGDLVPGAGAVQVNAAFQTRARDLLGNGALQRAIAHEVARQVHAPVAQQPAGLDEVAMALHVFEGRDADDLERAGPDAVGPRRGKEVGVYAAVDDVDLVA